MPNILTWYNHAQQLDLSPFGEQYSEWANPPPRGIQMPYGTNDILVAQVTVSEDGDDDLIITEHPVEQGATISDHAFKRPAECRLQMGWSEAWAEHQGAGSLVEVYNQILTLQASRLPFTVYTGKRVYSNMLIASLRVHTDARMEFSFMCDVAFKEVVLVNTTVVSVAGAVFNSNAIGDNQYAQNINMGQQQTTSVNLDGITALNLGL